MLFNPIVAMLHNTKTDRWHPIIFRESPLPGPHYDNTPIRHKSNGHHTEGFNTREEALEHINTTITEREPGIKKCIEKNIKWDGENTPVMTCFFNHDGTKLLM